MLEPLQHSPELNSVQILKGYRFGKDFTGTFPTAACSLKSQPGKDPYGNSITKLYCPILLEGQSTWIQIKNSEDVVFTLSEVNRTGLAPAHNTNVEEGESAFVIPEETEEQALDRIKHRFDILQRLVQGICAGAIKSLIVSGPAGVGKSHGIETELESQTVIGNFRYEFMKGMVTPIFLYQKLYDFSDPKSILVLDDCDAVFYDPLALNILKAALDSSRKRTITWGSESRILKEKDIPNTFEFKGAVIFITNLKFDKIRSDSLKEHLAAIESRSHYLDLTIDTPRDKLLRIRQVVRDSNLLTEYGFSPKKAEEIVDYIAENTPTLREVSLRIVKKIADLALYSDDWREFAKVTLQRGPGLWK